MRTLLIAAALIATPALLASPAAARDKRADTLVPKADAKPENCIPITSIRSTDVPDGQTIDFEMRNGRIYRNTLPYSCSRLGSEKRFSYKTSLSSLCSSDIITVLTTAGPGLSPGGSCGLGQFQEMTDTRPKRR